MIVHEQVAMALYALTTLERIERSKAMVQLKMLCAGLPADFSNFDARVWSYPHKQPHLKLAWAFNLCVFAFFLMCIFCQVIKLQDSLEMNFFWSTWIAFAITEPISKDLAALLTVFLYAVVAFFLLKLLLRRVGDNQAARKIKWRSTRSQMKKLVRRQRLKDAAEKREALRTRDAHAKAQVTKLVRRHELKRAAEARESAGEIRDGDGGSGAAGAGGGAGEASSRSRATTLSFQQLERLLSAVPGGQRRRKTATAKVGERRSATLTPDHSEGEEEASAPLPIPGAATVPAVALMRVVSQARRQDLHDGSPPDDADLDSPRSESSGTSYCTAAGMLAGEAAAHLQARARGKRVRRQLRDWRRSMRPFVSHLDWPESLPPFVSHEVWPPKLPAAGGKMSAGRAAVLIESLVRGYIARRGRRRSMEVRAAELREEVERGLATLPPAATERLQGMLDWAESTTAALAFTVRAQQSRLLARTQQQQEEEQEEEEEVQQQQPGEQQQPSEPPVEAAPPDLEKRASEWVRRQILLSLLAGSGADAARRLLLAVLEMRKGAGEASSVAVERLVVESSHERRSRRLVRGQLRGRVSDADALRLCEQLLLALEDVARLHEASDWLDAQLAQPIVSSPRRRRRAVQG